MHAKSETHKTLNLALFDFDGTLYPRDSFTGFIFFALSKRHIVKRGLKILPWIQAYYLRLYPAHAMRPRLFQSMFKDISADVVEQLAQEYALKLIKRLDQDLLQQLQQHQQRGDHIVLVSASVDIYLAPICEFLNIELICTQTEIKDGLLTGRYRSEDCSREQKKLRILQQYNLADYQAIYAYGNSEEDLDMLSLADYPYMVGRDTTVTVQ
ncbi:phosphoserine phosphatase [Acinetobacter gyllenbergii]|uniref:HAD hydrolase, family IB n=1 Tax=Acinetobacter gyllenbergii CIP 110306 = MTCC 11365 TaxID=1217657 RepID=A0A829HH56_9GAMM|nr:HAD-IB family hydrolase [Acinetobacter gyllenbergii]EPF80269.1 HAD hydrolase, family IB [Acinetobacter gyllenbergii CIP 110306 = MTCC 11365]EPH35105.1 Phosphoserine phosphatase [Acinetobacter gyllenbergii CIP 110306 = MTCC 11365]ESK53140.1 HAD hydrolase, family IB [Acinetobacter gyllenbergii NIPH 230]MCU4580369.1 HAD-IB family hydrolase [Acinetobacter gyllenbergii]OBY74999.1 phosphoserine phosphatase [Acinetobacter gyllenbergii]